MSAKCSGCGVRLRNALVATDDGRHHDIFRSTLDFTVVAQLIVRDVDDSPKRRLRQRAKLHGRSMEAEVREIPQAAAIQGPAFPTALGTCVANRFRGNGLDVSISGDAGQLLVAKAQSSYNAAGRRVRSVAQLGRALRSGRRGRRFKSSHSDQSPLMNSLPCRSPQPGLGVFGQAPEGVPMRVGRQRLQAGHRLLAAP